MKKFVFITFIPGSAGNFFTRCLALLNNVYGFIDNDKDPPYIPITLEEKLTLLNYDSVLNKKYEERNWIHFEEKCGVYCGHYPNHSIPDNGTLVIYCHPYDNEYYDSLVGEDDKQFVFYIDPTDHFEWMVLNAFYKNSFHYDLRWFIKGKKHLLDPAIHKIKLTNIISNFDSFFIEFEKICFIIEHDITANEKTAINFLYNQWITTTLTTEEIKKHYI